MAHALIVGGGAIGCSIALRLAQAGLTVTLLERTAPGAEASGAGAGMLAPQMESAGPGPMLELSLRSRGLYPAFVEEVEALSGLPVHYRPHGLLEAAFDEGQAHALEASVAWQRAMGLRAELLSGEEARALEPSLSSRAVAAVSLPDDHAVDNRLLTRALALACQRLGVRLRIGTARALLREGGRVVGADVEGEEVRADVVVLAAGAWSSLLEGSGLPPRAVFPVRGQMAVLQPRGAVPGRILFGPRGYLVPRVDGRLLAGSTMERVGFDKQVTAAGLAGLLEMAVQLCPSLSEAPLVETWAGFRPGTEDGLPLLGPGPLPGLVLATGHYRNGLLLTPVTARLVAALVLGERPLMDLRPFSYERLLPPTA